jgi:hypothetical protein
VWEEDSSENGERSEGVVQQSRSEQKEGGK